MRSAPLPETILSVAILFSGLFPGAQALADPCPTPSFVAARAFDAGSSPESLAVGDFNVDGKPDLAVASRFTHNVSVLLGKGDGTFQTAANYTAYAPVFVAVEDFNGDAKPDLVVLEFPVGTAHVAVLLGKGDGTFQAAARSDLAGGFPLTSMAVADFNNDGKPDVAVNWFGKPLVAVLLGNGNGTFRAAVTYDVNSPVASVAAGDLNGDGKSDLAAATSNGIAVLLGKGDGTFEAPALSAGNGSGSLATGDFNGDGKPDVAVGGGDAVWVWLGKGDGTFQVPVAYEAKEIRGSVAVGDFNGDGTPDFAVASQSGTVSVLLGKGDGTFHPLQAALSYSAGRNATSVVVADFNGDGKLDVATPGSMMFGNGDGTLQAAPNYSAGPNALSIAVSDFNRDGKADLVVANSGAISGGVGSVAVLLGQSNGTAGAAVNFGAGSNPHSVAVGDFNGDNNPDVAVANSGSADVSVLLGKGDGTFLPAVNYSAGTNAWSVAVCDFNGDGKRDLAVARAGSQQNNFSDGRLSLLLGNGDGTFRAAGSFLTVVHPDSVAAGDFDGDGKSDLVVASSYTDYVSVLLGNGNGLLLNAVNYTTGQGADSVAVGDLNRDGKPDLVVANSGARQGVSSSVSVLLGNGDGSFQTTINHGAAYAPISVAVGDFNGDGRADVAVGYLGGTISVLLGNGDGTLGETLSLGVGVGVPSVAVGDFNGDGSPDLGAANSGYVTVLLNACVASVGASLAVVRNSTFATLSWPIQSTNFVLESTINLSSTNWQSVFETPTTNNGRLEVTAPLEQSQRFFRLRTQ